jgi:hypothetical protein
MNSLTDVYDDLLTVQDQLDNLLKVAYFKLYRQEDIIHLDMTPEHKIKRYNEDEYDLLAYTNAINLKFRFYCNLAFVYLKCYLKYKFSLSLSSPKQILDQALNKNIIQAHEYNKLTQIAKYIKQIAEPDAHGNYGYSDEIIEFYKTLEKILSKLNPQTYAQEIILSQAHANNSSITLYKK